MTTRTYQVGGTLDPDRHYYIPRKADDQLLQLCLRGEYAHIFNASQTGKSSLIERTRRELKERGIHAIRVDLQGVGRDSDEDRWYHNVAHMIAGELKLRTDLEARWTAQASLTPTYRWVILFEQVVLTSVTEPVVIFIDEIDRTRSLSFRDDFFGALRLLYNERTARPELRRLTFVLAGLATPRELLGDSTQTGHNIWKGVSLGDLTEKDGAIDELAEGLGMPTAEKRKEALNWILSWTGGHPYLTQKLCARVQEQAWPECSDQDIHQLVDSEFLSGQNEDNNLSYIEGELTKERRDGITRTAVLAEYERVLTDGRVRDRNTAVQAELKLTGAVKAESGWLRVRNRIYQEAFDRAWLKRRFHLSLRGWWTIQPRLVKILTPALIIAVIGLSIAASWASYQQRQATAAAQQARARELAARSQLATDLPARRLLLGIEAIMATQRATDARVAEAEEALREALAQTGGIPLGAVNPFTSFHTLCFSPNGRWLAANSHDLLDDGSVLIWDMENLNAKPVVLHGQEQEYRIWALAFSPNGRWLASGSYNSKAQVWDMDDLSSAPVLLREQNSSTSLNNLTILQSTTALDFSPDGRWLAATGLPTMVLMWDMDNLDAQPVVLHSDGSHWLYNLAFSPDGYWVAIGGEDHTARIWDLRDLRATPVVLRGHNDSVLTLAFSPDGRWLATGSADGTARVWDMNIERLIEHACQLAVRNFTQEEWAQYFPNEPYRKTCAQWPVGQ